jgi:hypothetical protein
MSATTENTDGSGAVLMEEISALNVRIDLLRADIDAIERRQLQPCPEFPTSELIRVGTGPARVAVAQASTTADLSARVNEHLEGIESAGNLFERIEFAMAEDPEVDSGINYGALILYRLAPPATEAAS